MVISPTFDFSRAISSSRSSRSRSFKAVAAPASARSRHSLSLAIEPFVSRAQDSGAIARALSQSESADNMTDRMAALQTLSLHDRPERARALDDFYRRYADDPLVVDKWLALQA